MFFEIFMQRLGLQKVLKDSFSSSKFGTFPTIDILLFSHHLLGEKEGDLRKGDIEGQND